MSVIFFDGCDLYRTIDDLLNVWRSNFRTAIDVEAAPAAGRFGRGAIRLEAAAQSHLLRGFPRTVSSSTCVIGFWARFRSFTSQTANYFLVRLHALGNQNGSDYSHTAVAIVPNTRQVSLYTFEGSTATQRAITAGAALTLGKWHWLSFKTVLHQATGSISLRIDGTEVLTYAGDTLNSSSAILSPNPGGIHLGGSAQWDLLLDDIVALDGNGPSWNDHLDSMVVDTLWPAADTTPNQWVPDSGGDHKARLGSDGGSNFVDDGSRYLESVTPGHVDAFSLDPLLADPTAIAAVQARTFHGRRLGAVRRLRTNLLRGAAQHTGATRAGPCARYRDDRELVTTDPATGAAWTRAGINAARLRLEVV